MDRTIQRAYDLFRDVAASNQLPWWEWDFTTNKVTASDLKAKMIGYDPEDFRGVGYQAFTELIHPDDYETSMQAMRDHLYGSAPVYQTDYRIKKKDGEYTWYFDRGAIIERTEDGKPLLLRGIVLDLGPDLHAVSHDDAVVAAIRNLLPKADAENPVVLCSQCGRMRIGGAEWAVVSADFHKGFPAGVSHTLCEDCIHVLYPEDAEKIIARMREFEAL
ncbi:MAG: PAS domain-containing protein [Alkalispirochaeta sp.]